MNILVLNKRRSLRYGGLVEKRDATYVAPYYHVSDMFSTLQELNAPSRTVPLRRSGKKNRIHLATATPPYYMARDIIGKVLGMKGALYTEQDFTDSQLAVIDEQVRYLKRHSNKINPFHFIANPNDTVYLGSDAKTLYPALYGRNYAVPDLSDKLINPVGQVETILGDYGIKVYKSGYEVFDTYDFNVGQGHYKRMSPYAFARLVAGLYGHKNTDDDEGKIKFSIKRNVTHW